MIMLADLEFQEINFYLQESKVVHGIINEYEKIHDGGDV